ncbi:hypothetical protein [Agromyces sp. Leaf222]|uniref:hypothetical protein n=1 Tax=Agromyces sp. Leaf222 TaxID=1735688 RepID=UPI0006F930DB|nr:hypothetical protein [Agromyces sp. Leaf222]KQM82440.1 hypothetical protein ASE68_03360 [Agromyces sp. Leaf222]
MIGGLLPHVEGLPVVGGETTGAASWGVAIRVDILPLSCIRSCGPESLPLSGWSGDLLTWACVLLAGGAAALLLRTVAMRHPLGRARR